MYVYERLKGIPNLAHRKADISFLDFAVQRLDQHRLLSAAHVESVDWLTDWVYRVRSGPWSNRCTTRSTRRPVWARTGLLVMMAFAVVVGILRIVGSLAGRLVAVVGNCGSRGGPVGLRVRDRAAGSRVTDPSTDHHVIRTPDLAQLQIEMRIDVGRMKPTHPNRRQVSQLTTGQHCRATLNEMRSRLIRAAWHRVGLRSPFGSATERVTGASVRS